MSVRRGLLICNIGTPNSPRETDVGIYLKEFLMDKDVINLPWILRFPLVCGLIVPKRKKYSAHNYQKIWTAQGSPLMVETRRFAANLEGAVGDRYRVELGMRYGEPSIQTGLQKLKNAGVEEVVILPMFPQHAKATTGSVVQRAESLNRKHRWGFRLRVLPPYYREETFIDALAERFRKFGGDQPADHLLLTYHGLPQNQVREGQTCTLSESCCQQAEACERNCYRAQCLATSERLARKLGLDRSQWTVSFQSRLGRAEWIRPYTEEVLRELPGRGVRRLAVLCPSFSVDCLETLEEIAIQGAKTFKEAGGESFHLIPCLNEQVGYLLPLIERTADGELRQNL